MAPVRSQINREILALAIPSIVANITTPLLSLVDTAIVGHMGSQIFIAGIALGSTIFSMVYWVFGFLRMGTSGVTAQAFGAGDTDARDSALFRALSLAALIGLLLILLRHPIGNAMLRFLDSEPQSCAIASEYFSILIYGAPATLALYAVNGWLIGMQNSRATMWISLIVNIVNIAASLILVYMLRLGIAGVAFGSLIAQTVGIAAGLALTFRYHPRFPGLRKLLEKNALRRMFSINTDILLRTLCLVAVTVWFTRAGAAQGDTVLAVNALIMQLFILFSYIMDGFAFAGEALVGRYLGSGETDKRHQTVARLFVFGTAISLIFTILYALLGDSILALLSDNPNIAIAAGEYRWWAVTIPLAGMAAFIWDGIFIGLSRTRAMLAAMILAMAIFFAVYLLAYPTLGNHGLWLAFILYLLTRAITQTLIYKRIHH